MKLITKKRTNAILVLMLFTMCTMFFISCEEAESGSSKRMKTKLGYDLDMVIDVDGQAPMDGDVLLFSMKALAKDSVLTSTFDSEYPQEFKWIPQADRDKMNHPIVDAFGLMTKGDSARVYVPADSLKGPKFGLETGENLVYVLKVHDVLNGEAMAAYNQERQEKLQAERAKMQARAEEIGAEVQGYLDQYKLQKFGDQLIKDPSGLEYVIHEQGNGPKLKKGQPATVHYYGVLKSDGVMFDNSFRRGEPFSFALGQGQVISGWDIGVALLNKGTKATLFIPYQMAYGAAGKPPTIPEKSDLVFYIEVPE